MRKKVLILEDNVESLEMLSDIVKGISRDIEILKFSSMDGIYTAIMENVIDVFLTDIVINADEPGDVSGIKFIDNVRKMSQYAFTPVIFTSSLDDPEMYTYRELHSYSYIEKPYEPERVRKIVEQALQFNTPFDEDKQLFFKCAGLIYSIKCSDIIYAKSIKHKMCFHRKDGKEIIIPYKSCKQVLEEADYRKFVQCNRSVIFNVDYIEYIDVTNNCVKLERVEELIEIGVTFKKRISELVKYGV